MSYIEDSLGQGEVLVARAHFHWWYSLKAWLALIFLFPFLGLGIYLFVTMMVRKWKTEIGVTTHRFVERQGLFTLTTFEVALANIEGVRVTQSAWGQLLGYGHLRIEGTGVDHVDLPDIANPLVFRAAIETAKSQGR